MYRGNTSLDLPFHYQKCNKQSFVSRVVRREWENKPHRGRQRKTWGTVVDELFVFLGLDRQECMEAITRGERSLACREY